MMHVNEDGTQSVSPRGATPSDETVVEIPVRSLAPDPFQPRTVFSEERVRELAESLHQHGLLQPLLVRPMQGRNHEGQYWIVAGERRWRAAMLLGWTSVPCRVRAYENKTAAVVALAENVHREDLTEIDKAQSLLRIKTLTDRTWDEVAELVKLSRDYVKRLAGLLKLEAEVQELIRSGRISVRTAIALRPLPARQQVEMAERVVAEDLTAEQVRAEVSKRSRKRTSSTSRQSATSEMPGQARAPVAESIEGHTAAARSAQEWLAGRDWSPSRVTERHRGALDELHEAVSVLHQQLIGIRRRLRDQEPSPAELLRRAELPFK